MSTTYDAIIIGTGIIGNAVGMELARKGYKTLNLDKLPASGYGSTSNTCAIIRLHYSTPEGVAMARESYFYWLDWNKYIGVPDPKGMALYINTGCLVTKNERNHHLKNVMSSLDALHVVYEELTAREVRERFPFVDTRQYGPPVVADDSRFGEPTGDEIAGAVYIPESGLCNDPQLACHNQQVAAEAAGGKFLFNAEVVEILRNGGRAAGVKLADGTEIAAPIVVNVSGPHSFKVNQMAGVLDGMKIRTRALKQEVCHVPAPKGINYQVQSTIISDGDIGVYSRPEVGNHVLIGSEDPECDRLEWVDPDTYDKSFTYQYRTQVLREAQRIPELAVPQQEKGLVDLYDVTDDWLPIYDTSDLPGFYMAVGTSGNQFKNAPVAGKLMAELIEKVEGGHDHDKEPVKFFMKFTRRECNIGFFSRNRQLNPDSSYSVIG